MGARAGRTWTSWPVGVRPWPARAVVKTPILGARGLYQYARPREALAGLAALGLAESRYSPMTQAKDAEELRFLVRPATVADVPGIARVWNDAYPDQPGASELPSEFLAERTLSEFERRAVTRVACTVVGYDAMTEDIVGMVVALQEAEVPEIEQMFVLPVARGTGLSSRLFMAAERRLALAAPEATAKLYVFEQNTRARRFYERHGWQFRGVEPHDVEISGGRTFTLQLAKYEKLMPPASSSSALAPCLNCHLDPAKKEVWHAKGSELLGKMDAMLEAAKERRAAEKEAGES